MDSRGHLRRTKLATVLVLVALPATATAADRAATGSSPAARAQARGPADFDVRDRGRARAPDARTRSAQRRLRRSLGRGGVLELDRDTGTPSIVARLDGFLTPRRSGDPATIALRYLRANAAAFGLDSGDIASLRLKRRATTRRGLTRIEWEQVHDGVPAFDNVIRANVSRGRLMNVTGSPKADLSVPSTDPGLSSAEAVERALRSVGVRRDVRRLRTARDGTALISGGNRAKLVLFTEPGRPRLAWNTIARTGDGVYRVVLDAKTGAVLRRTNMVAGVQSLRAFDYTPNVGSATLHNVPVSAADPWLTQDTLRGDNAWAYTDQFDDRYEPQVRTTPPAAAQEVGPSSGTGANAIWDYPLATAATVPGSRCAASGCSWDGNDQAFTSPFVAGDNWQMNREQAATQGFYLVNNFHDHTQNDPNIDFSDAWGNFEQTATGPGTVGGDPVHVQTHDGAATALLSDDFPNGGYINNASMATLDEIPGDPFNSPLMSLLLFGDLDSSAPATDPNDVNSVDDAAIVYHEFIHGLSNRLVDPDGSGDLFINEQPFAMGEAWSDWYSMDYLNEQGLQPDLPGQIDIDYKDYTNVEFSFQGLDCTVDNTAQCPAPPGGAGAGGFTYGDFGNVFTGFEQHADGEIWAQTLWDLRRSLIAAHPADGIARARALVTDGMRLSPSDPDFLDMRNAILQANTVNGFGDCALLWSVFAARGMGANASTSGPGDTAPNEGFAPGTTCPPASPGGGTTPPPTAAATTSPPAPDLSLLLPARPSLSGLPRSVRADRRGRFRLRFRGGRNLRGSVELRTVSRVRTSRRSRARRRMRVARRSFTVSSSGRVSIRLRLSRRNLRILKLNRRYRVRATVKLRNPVGESKATRSFTLKAPRRAR